MSRDKPGDLHGWKEIAAFFNVTVRTAQSWETSRGLPVHRLPGKRGVVYASTGELRAWHRRPAEAPCAAQSDRVSYRTTTSLAVLIGVLTVAALAMFSIVVAERDAVAFRPRPLTSEPTREARPDLSPDARQLAFLGPAEGGQAALFVRPVAGGPAHALAFDVPKETFVKWSPDGTAIAFWRAAHDGLDLMTISTSDGVESCVVRLGGADRLTNIIDVMALDWAPKGASIAVPDRPALDAPYHIALVAVETGERQALTRPPAGIPGDTMMAYSPDGESLAFVRFWSYSESDVFLRELSSQREIRLTESGERVWGLDWTPDGEGIVYSIDPGPGHSALYRLDPGSGRVLRLTDGSNTAEHPSVARTRSGKTVIVFEQKRRHDNLWALTGDDDAPASVAASTWLDAYPSISPRKHEIAFVSERSGTHEIWVRSSDGSPPRRLTTRNGPYSDMPRWAPDGSRIAFTSADERGNRDIYVVDSSGTTTLRLTRAESEEGRPSWSHDGEWIYFRSDRSGSHQIWKTRTAGGGEPIQLTTGGGYEAFEDPGSRRLYYIRSRDSEELWMTGAGRRRGTIPHEGHSRKSLGGHDRRHSLRRRQDDQALRPSSRRDKDTPRTRDSTAARVHCIPGRELLRLEPD